VCRLRGRRPHYFHVAFHGLGQMGIHFVRDGHDVGQQQAENPNGSDCSARSRILLPAGFATRAPASPECSPADIEVLRGPGQSETRWPQVPCRLRPGPDSAAAPRLPPASVPGTIVVAQRNPTPCLARFRTHQARRDKRGRAPQQNYADSFLLQMRSRG